MKFFEKKKRKKQEQNNFQNPESTRPPRSAHESLKYDSTGHDGTACSIVGHRTECSIRRLSLSLAYAPIVLPLLGVCLEGCHGHTKHRHQAQKTYPTMCRLILEC